MRVLLASSMGGSGHLTPVLAAARAARRLGHDVLVLVPPSLAGAVDPDLPQVVGAQPPAAVVDDLWRRLRAGPPERVRGLIDRELFAGHAMEAMLPHARRTLAEWRPDLVLREPCEYGSAIAAHEHGVRQAQIGISQARIEAGVLDMVAPLIEQRAAGLAGVIRRRPYLSSFPTSLDPSPWPDTRRFREASPPPSPLPDWWHGDRRPLVYVTFGSVTGHLAEAASVYRTALEAVAPLPARVLLTVGREVDIAQLGPIPANVHVEPWVPQSDVLDQASLVLCHGGSGTTFGALGAGVPLVICPLFADQTNNGRLVREAGAGLVVEGREPARGGVRGLGPDDVEPMRQAVTQVLCEDRYRAAAERIGAEVRTAPLLDRVIEALLDQG